MASKIQQLVLEEDNIAFENVEDINLEDQLFEMSSVIDISKILSIHKKQNSKVVIMKKYYMQIPNYFEQENIDADDQAIYSSPDGNQELELIENEDGTASIARLDELYQVCTFFNIEWKFQAEIFRQYLKVKPIYAQEVRQLCWYKDAHDFIKNTTRYYITKQFEKNNLNYKNAIELAGRIGDILLKTMHIFHEISDIQFVSSADLQDLENRVISGQEAEIPKRQLNDFNNWRRFMELPIVTVNKCFYSKYDYNDIMTAKQVQEILTRQMNSLVFQTNNIDVQKDQFYEENYFNVSQRKLDYKFNNKIFLNVRQHNGTPFFVTKNNHEQFIANLFTKYMNSPDCLVLEDNLHVFETLVEQITQRQQIGVFTFAIKDFLMNIDYKLVELIGYVKLARYLRERRFYYVDPVTKEEVLLSEDAPTKGIFFGEVFTSDVATMVCQVLAKQIENKLKQQYNGIRVYFTQHTLMLTYQKVVFQSQMVDENEDAMIQQDLLKKISEILLNFGFEYLHSSVRYYSCSTQNKFVLHSLNNEGKFEDTKTLFFNGRDIFNYQPKSVEFSEQQIAHLNRLLEQFKVTKTINLSNEPYQELKNYFNCRLIKRYIRKYKSKPEPINKKDLNSLYKDIFQSVKLPFYKNKIPFFN